MKVIKRSELKDIKIESKNGSRESYYSDILSWVYVGFLLGAVLVFIALVINPIQTASIATQQCVMHNSVAFSYQWNPFRQNFESIICKGAYGIFELIQ